LIKFYGELGCGLEANWLHFGAYPLQYPNLGVRSRSRSGFRKHCHVVNIQRTDALQKSFTNFIMLAFGRGLCYLSTSSFNNFTLIIWDNGIDWVAQITSKSAECSLQIITYQISADQASRCVGRSRNNDGRGGGSYENLKRHGQEGRCKGMDLWHFTVVPINSQASQSITCFLHYEAKSKRKQKWISSSKRGHMLLGILDAAICYYKSRKARTVTQVGLTVGLHCEFAIKFNQFANNQRDISLCVCNFS